MAAELDRIVDRGLLHADPASAVLDVCRVVATFSGPAGTVLSNEEAGLWGVTHLPPRFRPLVALALASHDAADADTNADAGDWPGDDLSAFGRFAVGAVVRRRPGRKVAGLP